MGEMRPEADDKGDGSAWVLAIVLITLVAAIAGGGTLWGYFASRRAAEMAAMMQQQAEQMQFRAAETTERAETEAKRAEEEAQRARPVEDGAKAQAQRAAAIDELIGKAILAAEGSARDTDARAALDQAAARLEAGEVPDSNTAASLTSTLGLAYQSFGDLEKAEKHLSAAMELRTRTKGASSPEVAADIENLAKVRAARSK